MFFLFREGKIHYSDRVKVQSLFCFMVILNHRKYGMVLKRNWLQNSG